MNTDRLAKHYANLTPSERLSLLMAASARGDEAEYERLARSAPRVHFETPDTFSLAEALLLAAMLHMTDLLNRAAGFLAAFCRMSKGGDEGEEKVRRETVLLLAHRFMVTRDGWKRFASEFPFDLDLLLRVLPGYETVRLTEDALREFTPTAEEAAATPRSRGVKAGTAILRVAREGLVLILQGAWNTFRTTVRLDGPVPARAFRRRTETENPLPTRTPPSERKARSPCATPGRMPARRQGGRRCKW